MQSVDRLLIQAAQAEDSGRPQEAAALYQQALAREPNRPNTWFNLGRMLRLAGQPTAALQAYHQALRRGVSQAEEVHLNRGVIYSDDLRAGAEAEAEWRAALALNPRYVPAWMNLANLHEDRGHRGEALAAYEQLLRLAPASFEALARYAALKGVASPADPLLQHLRAAVASPQSKPLEKASLCFALGKLLDECAAYDDAFVAYTEANRFSRAAFGPGTARYDRLAQEQLVDRLIASFPLAQVPAVPSSGPAPIFVCGMFRSGSTLTEQVLAAHPLVAAGGELNFIPRLVAAELQPYPEAAAQASAAQWPSWAARYREQLSLVGQGAAQVTDKRPDNFLHIGLIKTLFPQARIVHTTRHAADNALSIFFLHLDPAMAYATDLEDIAHYMGQYRRLMAHWRACYGDDILEFPYDDFVQDPRSASQRLLAFCGLPWDEACLHFHELRNMVRTASAWQVRRPVFTSSSGRWKHYRQHLGPLLRALGESSAAMRRNSVP